MSPIDESSLLPTEPSESFSLPQSSTPANLAKKLMEAKAAEHGYAHVIYDRLKKSIEVFESQLKPNQEIGAYLASFGPQTMISIETIDYYNPYMLVFQGFDQDGNPVELVQHTTQLSLLFTVKTLDSGESGRRIGFHSDE